MKLFFIDTILNLFYFRPSKETNNFRFMKRFAITIMALLLALNFAAAQPQEGGKRPDKEKMTKMQIKRIVKGLALDNSTAEEFTKIYTAYKDECNKVTEKYPVLPPMDFDEEGNKKSKKGEEPMLPTDEEIEKQILNGFARERALLDLKEKYYKEFCKILSPQQIQKMYQLENPARQRVPNGNMTQGRPGGFPGGGPGMGGMMPPGGGMW